MQTTNDTLYQIALALTQHLGTATGRILLEELGEAENIFKEKKENLLKIDGVRKNVIDNLLDNAALKRAEQELTFIEKHDINTYFYTDSHYPRRLKRTPHAPLMMFGKGLMDLNAEKMVSVVGTRRATTYGREMAEKLVKGLASHGATVVSGLAHGIDIAAQRSALDEKIPTVAVLAHGLDRIYPPQHRPEAKRMTQNGGLLTDYITGTNPDRGNFPDRNRIIAGMSDATVVVESRLQGGSMITAKLASSYNRDVFAFPGKANDPNSPGCNFLIKSHQAALIEDILDLEYQMGWEADKRTKKQNAQVQKKLFVELAPEEEAILKTLESDGKLQVDEIGHKIGKTAGEVSFHLFNLEMNGLVKALPGKVYQLC